MSVYVGPSGLVELEQVHVESNSEHSRHLYNSGYNSRACGQATRTYACGAMTYHGILPQGRWVHVDLDPPLSCDVISLLSYSRHRVSPSPLPAARRRCGLSTRRLMAGPTTPTLRRRRQRGRGLKMPRSSPSCPLVINAQIIPQLPLVMLRSSPSRPLVINAQIIPQLPPGNAQIIPQLPPGNVCPDLPPPPPPPPPSPAAP